jgi:hypothetical protein
VGDGVRGWRALGSCPLKGFISNFVAFLVGYHYYAYSSSKEVNALNSMAELFCLSACFIFETV